MHKSIRIGFALIAALTWLPGCGSDDTTTTTTTDTANTADAASDATDTTSADAVDAVGDATVTYSFGAGCSGADDQAFRTMLGGDSAKASEFTGLIKDCTLTKGCLAKTPDSAAQDCIRDCILDSQLTKDGKLTSDCAACYGTYKGHCGAKKCISKCAVDAGSADCSACLKENCDPIYELCLEGDK